MAQVFTKWILSGSTDGMGIKVGATTTPGTLIHTWPTNIAQYDEVWLYLQNTSAATVTATVEFWDATAPDHNISLDIPPRTMILAVPGFILKGNATPKTVKVFAGTTNVITATWYIHNIA